MEPTSGASRFGPPSGAQDLLRAAGSPNVERYNTKRQSRRDRGFVSQCYDSAQGRVTLHIKLSSRIGSLPPHLQHSDPYLKKHLDTFLPLYDR